MHPLWSTALVFASCLVVFHGPILYVRWRKKGILRNKDRWAYLWEMSDYLTVGLAVIFLIPAANEVYRLQSGEILSNRIKSDSYKVYDFPNYDRKDNPLGFSVRFIVRGIDKNKEANVYLYDYESTVLSMDIALESARELFSYHRYIEAEEKLDWALYRCDLFTSLPMPASVREAEVEYFIERQLQIRRKYTADLREHYHGMRKQPSELHFLMLAPYILSIGFALRIAKVSAKLVLENQKRLFSVPQSPPSLPAPGALGPTVTASTTSLAHCLLEKKGGSLEPAEPES